MRTMWQWNLAATVGLMTLPFLGAVGLNAPLDPRVSAKGTSLGAIALAIFAATSLLANLGDLELIRARSLYGLRAIQSAVVVAPVLAIETLMAVLLGPEDAELLGATFGGALAIQLVTAKFAPGVPVWAPVVTLAAIQFILGVNQQDHTFSPWAVWLAPGSMGIVTGLAAGAVSLAWWLAIGSFTPPSS